VFGSLTVSKPSLSSTLTSHIEGDPPRGRACRVAGHAGVFPGVRRLGARDGHGAAQGVHLHLGRLADHRLLSYGGGWEQKVNAFGQVWSSLNHGEQWEREGEVNEKENENTLDEFTRGRACFILAKMSSTDIFNGLNGCSR